MQRPHQHQLPTHVSPPCAPAEGPAELFPAADVAAMKWAPPAAPPPPPPRGTRLNLPSFNASSPLAPAGELGEPDEFLEQLEDFEEDLAAEVATGGVPWCAPHHPATCHMYGRGPAPPTTCCCCCCSCCCGSSCRGSSGGTASSLLGSPDAALLASCALGQQPLPPAQLSSCWHPVGPWWRRGGPHVASQALGLTSLLFPAPGLAGFLRCRGEQALAAVQRLLVQSEELALYSLRALPSSKRLDVRLDKLTSDPRGALWAGVGAGGTGIAGASAALSICLGPHSLMGWRDTCTHTCCGPQLRWEAGCVHPFVAGHRFPGAPNGVLASTAPWGEPCGPPALLAHPAMPGCRPVRLALAG